MDKNIFVYIDLQKETHFVGTLWVKEKKGQESSTFEYSPEWQSSAFRFPLEPALVLGQGKYHTNKALFGSIGDSAPDRWGSMLMNRYEARKANFEGRVARRLRPSDYLLMVDDRTRQGALRFSDVKDGPFLASYKNIHIPPLIQLGKLLNASSRILMGEDIDQDIKDVVEPGSSLGGARPKAVVLDTNGNLLIAKFPSPKDDWDVELWEYLSLILANKAGITTPGFRLETVMNKNVLLLNRFDRDKNQHRIPFLSAMSLLNALDGETKSYLEVADSIMENGCNIMEDLKELWRRIVFNIMISNLDDHLRNHGFLYNGLSGWRMSPIYDLEPTPEHVKARFLRTNINMYDNTASLDIAYEVADHFGLNLSQARNIAKEVADATNNWRQEALKIKANKQEIDFMSSAFQHDDLRQALKNKLVSTNNSENQNIEPSDSPRL
jgi:serine/threonine-protein kinase HipA